MAQFQKLNLFFCKTPLQKQEEEQLISNLVELVQLDDVVAVQAKLELYLQCWQKNEVNRIILSPQVFSAIGSLAMLQTLQAFLKPVIEINEFLRLSLREQVAAFSFS